MKILRRVFHFLFDDRYVALCRWRPAHLWFAWTPYIGGSVDVNIQFIPSHKAHSRDEDDVSWGPEFRFGADLLWISFGVTIPNDDYPDNNVEVPPHYCRSCGREAEPMISYRCTGCDEHVDSCPCDQAPDGYTRRITIGPDAALYRTKVDEEQPPRPADPFLHRILTESPIYPSFPSIRVAKR
jgi:hypothetical protein